MLWCFECPECQFDNVEAGKLATDEQVYCPVCAGDSGRDVRLRRWAPDTRVEERD